MTDDAVALLVRALAAALLHSIWQGCLIAALLAVALRALRRAPAQARYVSACAALAAMFGAWVLTAHAVASVARPLGEARARIVSPVPAEPSAPVPRDTAPAIRIFASRGALDASMVSRPSWRQRLDLWSTSVVPFWLAGVVLLAGRLVLSCLGVARLRRGPFVPVPRAVDVLAHDVAARLGIARLVRVVEAARVSAPVLVGWLKPVVMLPASAIAGLSPAQLESILAHELAHVRRHDVLVNAGQAVIEVVLFYHPVCWWISRRIRVEREHCCDDIAVAACGDELVYATALADLESQRNATRLALSAADGALLDRVRRILSMRDGGEHAGRAVPATLMAAVAVALVVGALTLRASSGDGQTSTPTAGRSIPPDRAVLQGRVVEAGSGRPVPGARVQAMSPNGTFEGATDADGRYEIASLTPGSYTVAARAQGFVDGYYGRGPGMAQDFGAQVMTRGGRITAGIDLRVQRAGRVSGRIFDANGNGLAGVEIELVRPHPEPGDSIRRAVAFAQTEEGGAYDLAGVAPGDYFVRAYIGRYGAPDLFQLLDTLARATGTPAVYGSTFYPGVADEQAAQPVRVNAGQELPGVDFALATTGRFTVAGRIVDETGGSFEGGAVSLVSMNPNGRPEQAPTAPIDAQGRFELHDVIPGTYMARIVPLAPRPPGPPAPGAPSRLFIPPDPLTVTDADVSDLELRVRATARLAFSLVPDIGVTRRFERESLGLSVARGPFDGAGLQMSTFGKLLGPEGTPLEMTAASGPVFFKVEAPPGWMVKAIRLDGRDLEDGVAELAPGRREVEVVVTDRVSGVSGAVVDRRGRPMPNYSVIVFPPEPTRWHVVSPAIREARTDSDGRFQIDRLPPGTYRAVAVPALARMTLESAAVLERLETSSEEIRLAEGQSLVVSIRASAMPAGPAP